MAKDNQWSADQEDRDDVLEEPRETGSATDQERGKRADPPTPGDNRRAGDVDGNQTAASGKARGPEEP